MRVERRNGARTMRRILIGGIAHETNTFSRVPTDLDQFRQRVFITGPEMVASFSGTRTVLGGFLDGTATLSAASVPLVYASATPGGIVTRTAYAELRAALLNGIRVAGPADAVLLALHGAMVVDGTPDAEGDLLRAVRESVGGRVPIIATLDSHANITRAMIDAADALVAYTTYPHIDTYERGFEATQILGRLWQDRRPATMALRAPPLLAPLPPQCTMVESPMRALLDTANRERAHSDVLNISIAGGFPYSDVHDAGLSVLVTTLANPALAHEISARLADAAWSRRAEFRPTLTPIAETVHRVATATHTPVVLADSGDNPGAGAPCDGTALLHALHAAGIQDVIVGVICDPETVAQAVAAGKNAEIAVRLGGKTDDRHGTPLHTAARVVRITDGVFTNTGPMGTGGRTRMGRTAVLALQGIRVIVTEQRVQALDLSLFRSVGIEPTVARAIVVKSSVHFRAAFAPIAAAIVDVDTPGISSPHLERFTFHRLRRPVWPLDANASFTTGGAR